MYLKSLTAYPGVLPLAVSLPLFAAPLISVTPVSPIHSTFLCSLSFPPLLGSSSALPLLTSPLIPLPFELFEEVGGPEEKGAG